MRMMAHGITGLERVNNAVGNSGYAKCFQAIHHYERSITYKPYKPYEPYKALSVTFQLKFYL